MKRIILLFFLFGILACSSNNKSNGSNGSSGPTGCQETFEVLRHLIYSCEGDSSRVNDMNVYEYCQIKTQNTSNSQDKICFDQLSKLSCEEIKSIKTISDVEKLDNCLKGGNRSKIELCITNQKLFCANLYRECKDKNYPQICSDALELLNGTEINFNKDMIESYCSKMENGNQEISGKEDFFTHTCSDLTYDCNNVPEMNFLDDSWKAVCQ